MPVECMVSNLVSDVRCVVCGQGFLLFGERFALRQRDGLRRFVQQALRQHHHLRGNHPAQRFTLAVPGDVCQAP